MIDIDGFRCLKKVFPQMYDLFHPSSNCLPSQAKKCSGVQCGALTCLFHLSLIVYDSIMKESDLSDLEKKHLTKRAKYSQNDIG